MTVYYWFRFSFSGNQRNANTIAVTFKGYRERTNNFVNSQIAFDATSAKSTVSECIHFFALFKYIYNVYQACAGVYCSSFHALIHAQTFGHLKTVNNFFYFYQQRKCQTVILIRTNELENVIIYIQRMPCRTCTFKFDFERGSLSMCVAITSGFTMRHFLNEIEFCLRSSQVRTHKLYISCEYCSFLDMLRSVK